MFGSPREESCLSVRDVNRLAKSTLEEELGRLTVQGELSNVYHASSGHCYFTLKDADAELKGMIWRPSVQRLSFRPDNGQMVRATGSLTIYEVRGTFQIVADTLTEVGEGALDAKLRQLRKKYAEMGWFDDEWKKPLPFLPKVIGLVTSPTSAAVHDMLRVIHERMPGAHVIIYGVLVQGDRARTEIAAAIARANADRWVDVLVVGRGGGSLEDLWAFNEPEVVEAIFHSEIPVVSAVGHEVDTCLSDLVADSRALTPTDAGAQIVPDAAELLSDLSEVRRRLDRSIRREMQRLSQRLDLVTARRELRDGLGLTEPYRLRMAAAVRQAALHVRLRLDHAGMALNSLKSRVKGSSPAAGVARSQHQLESLRSRLNLSTEALLAATRSSISSSSRRLNALSPVAILERGYSITTSRRTGEILRDPADAQIGDELSTRLAGGKVTSRVVEDDDC